MLKFSSTEKKALANASSEFIERWRKQDGPVFSLYKGLGFQAADGGEVWKMKQAENDYNLDPPI